MRGWMLYVFLPSEAFLTECGLKIDLAESNGNEILNIYTQFCLIISIREYRSVENVSTHDFAQFCLTIPVREYRSVENVFTHDFTQFCLIIPVREYRSVENVSIHDICIPLGMLPNLLSV